MLFTPSLNYRAWATRASGTVKLAQTGGEKLTSYWRRYTDDYLCSSGGKPRNGSQLESQKFQKNLGDHVNVRAAIVTHMRQSWSGGDTHYSLPGKHHEFERASVCSPKNAIISNAFMIMHASRRRTATTFSKGFTLPSCSFGSESEQLFCE